MKKLKNYINGEWVESKSDKYLNVVDPGNGEVISQVPEGCAEDVKFAAASASKVFLEWRNTPAEKRIQYLFKMKTILENNADEIAIISTKECGKTFAESKAEIVRAVENIEVACGIPTLMQGEFSEDIASGIDEYVIRQPLGVGSCIAPFNFPIMITFWFMPYAIACGNTYIVKPSEKVPETMTKIFELLEELNLPKGVLNLVHGGKETVDGILTHPEIKAISFVGSSKIAKYVYSKGTENGKRVQAQGGAKNPVVIMSDADVETTTNIISDSVYGCAGQRCLAASTVILVGEAKDKFVQKLIDSAKSKTTCYGLDKASQMGAIITKESKERILKIINEAEEKGANVLLDGRNQNVENYETGNYVFPTIIENAPIDTDAATTEIFGPVMNLKYAENLDEAISFINSSKYGNAACIFTSDGSAARKFRHDVVAGNIGVNIGIAAPMAFFPFSGWKESFYGDLHAQSNHAVEFYTQTKVVIERWYSEWTRKF
ncbi:MAG: CoA-acylating methylmalonate-semialdehyde dehydrogenase [Ignavibacteriae bacterium]|nr:CoA-acylating methylmalonate-semialdehyde dehydrogenase [Ignavibacteriota bacterium]